MKDLSVHSGCVINQKMDIDNILNFEGTENTLQYLYSK